MPDTLETVEFKPRAQLEAAVEHLPGAAKRLLILCDHASNAFPEAYGSLGLPPGELERHIAYDIGAAGVTRSLAKALGAPALLSRYSRLLIDINRGTDDPTLIMRLSDRTIVPGNIEVDAAETARRIRLYHEPYHAAIDTAISLALAAKEAPALLSIHSFTDNWRGCPRPWHVSVLWDHDARLAKPLIEALRQEPGLVVGENEPYVGPLPGDTLYRHAAQRGLAHALIEIRQDLIRSATGQALWAERLARIMGRILADQEVQAAVQKIRHFGCHANAAGLLHADGAARSL